MKKNIEDLIDNHPVLFFFSIGCIFLAATIHMLCISGKDDAAYIKTHYIYCQVVGKDEKNTALYCKQEPSKKVITVSDATLYFNTPIGGWMKTEPTDVPSDHSIFTLFFIITGILTFVFMLFALISLMD